MQRATDISLPDRYDVLQRKASDQLSQIISPVVEALEHIDALHEDMNASGRGQLLILRGDSGTGKSTFIHTVGLFRDGVETTTVEREADISQVLSETRPTGAPLRIIVLEGREALTDVSDELLEKAIHAINAFVRSRSGERTIVAWPVNRDDLSERLRSLARELGAEALTGLDDPIYRFNGPEKSAYKSIADNTISLLNQGAGIHDLGISDQRCSQLLSEATTIGIFLAKIRRDLLANQRSLSSLVKKERCRVWIVVIAGNEPDGDIDGLTRGTLYSADVDRMLSVTNANIVQELKKFPEKLGMLGTYLDARILHVPVLAALSVVRTYANDELKVLMRSSGMATGIEKDARERLLETNLSLSFLNSPIGARKVGGKIGSNSVTAFEKLAAIAADNDAILNRAIAEGLKDAGLINSYQLERDFGDGLTRRTDIVVDSSESTVRLEIMWRKKTGRAEIANYSLTKLFNYGRAIGYLV